MIAVTSFRALLACSASFFVLPMIICISHEFSQVASVFLPHDVELMKVNISQKRRDYSALWATCFAFLIGIIIHNTAFSYCHRSFTTRRSFNHISTSFLSCHGFNGIKIPSDIGVYYPPSFVIARFAYYFQGLVCGIASFGVVELFLWCCSLSGHSLALTFSKNLNEAGFLPYVQVCCLYDCG